MLGEIEQQEQSYIAKFDIWELRSAFQPVISLSHSKVIGYEGLIRPFSNGDGMSPFQFFNTLGNSVDLGELDRTCRVLHMLNAAQTLETELGWLFLNIDSRTILHDLRSATVIRDSLESIGLAPEKIVLEIVEKKIHDNSMLQRFADHYRDAGFRVAVDDFGAEEANFERIAFARPDIVKLDRSIIHNLSFNKNGKNILKRIVNLLHEMGCNVLVEGVETEQQAEMTLSTDADMVQGYYFSVPKIGDPASTIDHSFQQKIDELNHVQRPALDLRKPHNKTVHEQLSKIFSQALQEFTAGKATPGESCFANPHIRRYYLLDTHGVQQGECVLNPGLDHSHLEKHPLGSADGARWTRRKYFKNAMKYPGVICYTDPYLSQPEERAAVTFSCTFEGPQGLQVLCMDVDARAFVR